MDDNIRLRIISMVKEGHTYKEIRWELGVPESTARDFIHKRGKKNTSWWDSYKGEHPFSKGSSSGKEELAVAPEDTYPASLLPPHPKTEPIQIQTHKGLAAPYSKHAFIADPQVREGISFDYLSWIGTYLAYEQPDVIINVGDHFDLPSLSSYDRGKRKAEGKRLWADIDAGIRGMNALLYPIYKLQQTQLQTLGRVSYKPKMVFTTGNHEQRLERHLEANPELHGLVSYSDFKLEENGWEVYDFLEPAIINGVMYIHYLPNKNTGKPVGGSALNVLNKAGCSISTGHVQMFDIAQRNIASGESQWGLICGAGYPHKEDYKGYVGNHHFRGIVIKNNVHNGDYSPNILSLKDLECFYNSVSE